MIELDRLRLSELKMSSILLDGYDGQNALLRGYFMEFRSKRYDNGLVEVILGKRYVLHIPKLDYEKFPCNISNFTLSDSTTFNVKDIFTTGSDTLIPHRVFILSSLDFLTVLGYVDHASVDFYCTPLVFDVLLLFVCYTLFRWE